MSIAMPTIGCPSMRQRIQPDASTSEVLPAPHPSRSMTRGRPTGRNNRFERKNRRALVGRNA